jgi:hypothetical protein
MGGAHLFDLRPESMTILKRVTDIIAHKKRADFDSHHLTLCVLRIIVI